MVKILVLGGGFGGVRVALDLQGKIRKEDEIFLINDSLDHCYIPDLYDVATAKLKNLKKKDFKRLKASVSVSLNTIFEGKKVKVLVDKILGIDLEKKEVEGEKGKYNYDFLVIAFGSDSSYFGIAGASDFPHPLKSAEDALNIRDDVYELVQSGKDKVQILVAGGGFTGVELSGAMGPLLGGHGKVMVIEATGNVLGGMPKWAQLDALKKLKQQKVDVKLNCAIGEVKHDELVTKDGEKIPFDYLIWTAGIKGINLEKGILGVELGKKSQIPVLDDLSVSNFPEVFVVGDFAQIGNPDKGFVPQTAWAAIEEAKVAAENIRFKMNGERLTNFVSPKSQFVVPIGELWGLSNAFGLKIKGTLAWLIKEFIAIRYLLSILPLGKALKVWLSEVKVDVSEH